MSKPTYSYSGNYVRNLVQQLQAGEVNLRQMGHIAEVLMAKAEEAEQLKTQLQALRNQEGSERDFDRHVNESLQTVDEKLARLAGELGITQININREQLIDACTAVLQERAIQKKREEVEQREKARIAEYEAAKVRYGKLRAEARSIVERFGPEIEKAVTPHPFEAMNRAIEVVVGELHRRRSEAAQHHSE